MAFGGGLDDGDDVVSEINMTPLVDVMLVLLIIFIITVPVLTNSVRLDLPRAQSAINDVKPQTVTISITADGAAHWNEEAVDEAELERRLTAAAARTPQPEIQLRGDRKAAYEHVIRAMAAAQRAGIEKLGFVTEPGT
ncbi:ExbD/TolR family protein [Noviherbaspirillum pedocola]|uniref:Biopolymer transporter ExbD n=1 Tax=Noviherbaspirillum pedocola TaxID=2801341 RepID=A0A934SV59_9BURK|nr:biopolymer transporter ExbD [Noviherbaspirillum pedocola]MBK4737160.1 biopolymer transporter ExbD [Noviherbaspirillum pedocola]